MVTREEIDAKNAHYAALFGDRVWDRVREVWTNMALYKGAEGAYNAVEDEFGTDVAEACKEVHRMYLKYYEGEIEDE